MPTATHRSLCNFLLPSIASLLPFSFSLEAWTATPLLSFTAPTSHLLVLGCATSRWLPVEKRSPKDETPSASGRKRPSSIDGEADAKGKGSEHATTVHLSVFVAHPGPDGGVDADARQQRQARSGRRARAVAHHLRDQGRRVHLLPPLREAHGQAPHSVLAVDVYCCKIRGLVDPPPPHLTGRISFHCLNVKNDSRLEGLSKCSSGRKTR